MHDRYRDQKRLDPRRREPMKIESLRVHSPQLAASSESPIESPSFPHVLSGASAGLTTGESGSGPPIQTFGGDGFRKILLKVVRYPAACSRIVHFMLSRALPTQFDWRKFF